MGWLLALLPMSCSSKSSDPNVNIPHSAPLTAWVGQSDAGMHLVLEALLGPQDPHNARLSEEGLLREHLDLAAAEPLLRLHLFGSLEQIAESGTMFLQDQGFESFGPRPKSLPVREALLWNTALRGLPLPGESEHHLTRRTLLLHGPAGATISAEKPAVWRANGVEVNLEIRTWSELERRKYFDWAITPPDPEPKNEKS
jgi:hypothetical protein